MRLKVKELNAKEYHDMYHAPVKINIPPMSVNKAWQGKRFKTKTYIKYEEAVLLMLPNFVLPEPPYKVIFEFGFSNPLSDVDNPTKPCMDILQKKYGFNDRDVYHIELIKKITAKGQEYFAFSITNKF